MIYFTWIEFTYAFGRFNYLFVGSVAKRKASIRPVFYINILYNT